MAGLGNTHEIPGWGPGTTGRKKPVGLKCSEWLASHVSRWGQGRPKIVLQLRVGDGGRVELFVLLESTSARTQPQVTAGRLRKAGKSQTLGALEEKSSRGAWLAQSGEECHW